MRLSERMRQVLAIEPDSWALEYEGAQFTWGQLSDFAGVIGQAIDDSGAQPHAVIGWAAENTAGMVGAMTALMLREYCTATINPHMAPKILAQEIRLQRFPAIVADAHFYEMPGIIDAARDAGTACLIVEWNATEASVKGYPGLEKVGAGPHRDPMPGTVIERLSSGTTGPPKRSPQSEKATLIALSLGERKEKGVPEALTVKRSPSIIFRSLAHSGSFATMLALYSARPILLQAKFSIEHTMAAVSRHRPKVMSLVPTMIKMIWDADVPRDMLSSLIALRTGTAPLDPKLQANFEEKYGIPILVDYGATEFGGVAAWTMGDHKQFAAAKRGSVGRAVAGVALRIVSQENGAQIHDGTMGILEVMVDGKTTDWISTTDLARIDADGFLYILGRADDAIVRGGFKVLPDDVIKVLRQHPEVRDAAVVGVPDDRLGHVPVAVIEARDDSKRPDPAELKAFARDHLTPYQVPVAYKFTDKLPRSVSMKVIKAEVLAIATR